MQWIGGVVRAPNAAGDQRRPVTVRWIAVLGGRLEQGSGVLVRDDEKGAGGT